MSDHTWVEVKIRKSDELALIEHLGEYSYVEDETDTSMLVSYEEYGGGAFDELEELAALNIPFISYCGAGGGFGPTITVSIGDGRAVEIEVGMGGGYVVHMGPDGLVTRESVDYVEMVERLREEASRAITAGDVPIVEEEKPIVQTPPKNINLRFQGRKAS